MLTTRTPERVFGALSRAYIALLVWLYACRVRRVRAVLRPPPAPTAMSPYSPAVRLPVAAVMVCSINVRLGGKMHHGIWIDLADHLADSFRISQVGVDEFVSR